MKKVYPDLYKLADEIRKQFQESDSTPKSKPSGLMSKKGSSNG